MRLRVEYNQAAWFKALTQKQGVVADAAADALREIAAVSVAEGRLNIAASGHFTKRWVTGLQYQLIGAKTTKPKVEIYHTVGLSGVFQYGATIAGHPLLWIPTQRELRNIPPRRARRYGVKLVSATINGQPVLFDANVPSRDRKPLYIGVPSVHVRKRWRVVEIIKANVKKFSALFLKHFKV